MTYFLGLKSGISSVSRSLRPSFTCKLFSYTRNVLLHTTKNTFNYTVCVKINTVIYNEGYVETISNWWLWLRIPWYLDLFSELTKQQSEEKKRGIISLFSLRQDFRPQLLSTLPLQICVCWGAHVCLHCMLEVVQVPG